MPKYLMLFSYTTILLLLSIFVYERELLLGRMEYDINTSYAMLSRGIPCNMPRVTCIFRIHTSLSASVYAKKIRVTSGIFHGIPRESIA